MNVSRGKLRVVLRPYQWVTLCQLEDPFANPAYFCHHLQAYITADVNNTAITHIEVHESEDGEYWVRLDVHESLVAGGKINIDMSHLRRHVRIVLYSTGSSIVYGVKQTTELQALPGFVLSPVAVEEAEPTVTVELAEPPVQCKAGYTLEVSLDWTPHWICWEWFGNPTIVDGGDSKIAGGFPWGWWVLSDEEGEGCELLYPDFNLYVRDSDDVVYFDNLIGTTLSLNYDAFPFGETLPVPPEVVTGAYAAANTFYVWFNQRASGFDVAEDEESVIKLITVTNTGTCILLVNGTALAAGEVFTLNDFRYAGYGTGDMSEWLGGTPLEL